MMLQTQLNFLIYIITQIIVLQAWLQILTYLNNNATLAFCLVFMFIKIIQYIMILRSAKITFKKMQ